MKTVLATLLTVLLLLPVAAFGEIQTVTHTVKQPFGGSQSPDDARISAVAKAKREALEMAGTYIESLTVVKNSQVDAAGVLKAEVVSQKNYASDGAKAYLARGFCHFLIKENRYLGCRDLQYACTLGDCKALEFAKGEGYCC